MDERPPIKWVVSRDPEKQSRDYKSPPIPDRHCIGPHHVASRVHKWYDPQTKNWVVYRICEHDYQIGSSVYVYAQVSADIEAQHMLDTIDASDNSGRM